VFSQEKDNDNQIALLYYSKAEYTKAAEVYSNLYRKTHSEVHFEYLISCYKNLKEYSTAIEVTEEQIKFYPRVYLYKIILADLYEQTNNIKEAESIYQKTTKKALKEEYDCIELSDAYINLSKYTEAKSFLELAKKKYPKSGIFTKKNCTILLKLGSYKELVNEYISLILTDKNELEFVQNEVQYLIYENKKSELRDYFFEAIQRNLEVKPESVVLNELLIWLYTQEGNLKQAFAFAKALDIREKENGEQVYELGKIALSNKDYEIATKCFSYIIDKGIDSYYYEVALRSLLKTAQDKTFNSPSVTQADIIQLESLYIDALKKLGKNANTVDVARSLAHIQAFYLNKFDEAIQLLDEFLIYPRIQHTEKGLCQIEKADILVFEGDIWSANLLYAKVTLTHKNNDIGHTAKFQQAKLAFYNGQFEYAQALLDVIKASTSKLISNDAFELAHLISDNSALDTSTVALSMFAKADLALFQKKYDLVNQYYDSITTNFPGHSLEDEILYRKAIIAKSKGDTALMVKNFNEICDRFSYDVLADNAHYELAKYYDYTAHEYTKAKEHYKQIILNFPTSFYISDSRKRYRELEQQ